MQQMGKQVSNDHRAEECKKCANRVQSYSSVGLQYLWTQGSLKGETVSKYSRAGGRAGAGAASAAADRKNPRIMVMVF